MSKSRIEGLSDGVFAIAMTLLVLKLEVPEVMFHSSNAQMLMQLLALTPAFATYVVTFMISGGFWYLHHLSFHFIRHVDGILVWLNLIFLMLVSLLPFSAGLMGHFFIHPVSQLFYFGNQLGIAVVLLIHWHYAKRAGLVVAGGDATGELRIDYRTATVVIGFGTAMGVAAVDYRFSEVSLLVVLVGGFVLEQVRAGRRMAGLKNEVGIELGPGD